MKVFKYLLLPVIGLIGLAAIAVFALFVLVDPNRYKPALESLFARQTDLQLNIAGDINWTFRPVFGLNIEDVRVSNGVTPRELASFSSVSLKVVPASVFGDTLEIEEFIANDLHMNWIVDANGVNNWFVEEPAPAASQSTQAPAPDATPAPASDSQEEVVAEDIAAEIQQITIRNARIAVQDAQRGINTSLENLNFSSMGTNFVNRPFPFTLTFRMIDYAANRNMQLNLESTATIDYSAGNARLDELELRLSPLVLNGHVEVSDFHNNLAWSSELSSNQFNLSHFMENFIEPAADGTVLPGNFDNSEELVSLQLAVNGDEAGVSIPTLLLTLDGTQAQADIEFRYATDSRPDTLVYRLDANTIDLDRYLGTSQEALLAAEAETAPAAGGAADAPEQAAETETASAETAAPGSAPATPAPVAANSTPAPAQDIEIPVELLNSMNIIGNHNIEHLRFSGLDFTDIALALKLENGVMTVETQPVGFYEGQFAVLANLDASTSTPALTASAGLDGVDLVALADSVRAAEFATGRLNAESKYVASGSTVDEMINSLAGSTTFNIAENSVNIAMIKQVFAAISALSPSGQIGANWPDTLSFTQFDGHLSFSQGLASGQELQLRMDNFNVTGSGGIDLAAQRFDYDMEFIILGEPAVQTIPVNENYQGIAWPVRCEAEFTAEPRQYCGPDFQRVRELFAQIGRNEVQRRVEEAIQDKVPEELQDAAGGLLRNIFRR